jgi:hypothetical protein
MKDGSTAVPRSNDGDGRAEAGQQVTGVFRPEEARLGASRSIEHSMSDSSTY